MPDKNMLDSNLDWIALAKAELKGKEPVETLSFTWKDFSVKPYYAASDRILDSPSFEKRSENSSRPNDWLNLPLITSDADLSANQLALNHLSNGADGVVFKISDSSTPEILMKDIQPEFCHIGFEVNDFPVSFFEQWQSILPSKNIYGSIFWDKTPDWLMVANLFKGYEKIRCFGIKVSMDDPANNLLAALNTALQISDRLTDFGFNAQSVFNRMAFTVQASDNFFGDVCTIRALRILMNRLAVGYGLNHVQSFIRVQINPSINENYQPHGEMISNTFSALAAVAASADAITINSENSNSDIHIQTARNISLLLKNESKLDNVIDPLAGAYFIENLTNQIVKKVWTKFIKP